MMKSRRLWAEGPPGPGRRGQPEAEGPGRRGQPEVSPKPI